jgi:hypothetical protein
LLKNTTNAAGLNKPARANIKADEIFPKNASILFLKAGDSD